ncbi:MAG: hypothetical protein ACK5IM_02935, partial [Demequina sp.]
VGFYRSRHAALERGIVEAFSWGGLTSGRRSTALWLFLAPFARVNVAGWMLPREQQDDSGYERAARGRAERWRNGGVRVVTLMMTGLLALAGLQSALALLGLLDATRASGPPLLATAVLVGGLLPVALHLITRAGSHERKPGEARHWDDPWGHAEYVKSLASAHLGAALGAVAMMAGALAVATSASAWAVVGAVVGAAATGIAAVVAIAISMDSSTRFGVMGTAAAAGGAAAWLATVVAIGTSGGAERRVADAVGGSMTYGFIVLAVLGVGGALAMCGAELRLPVRSSRWFSATFAVWGLFVLLTACGALLYLVLGWRSGVGLWEFARSPEPAALFAWARTVAVLLAVALLYVVARFVWAQRPLAARAPDHASAGFDLRRAIDEAPSVLRQAAAGLAVGALVTLVAWWVDTGADSRVAPTWSDPAAGWGLLGWVALAAVLVALAWHVAWTWIKAAVVVAAGLGLVGLHELLDAAGVLPGDAIVPAAGASGLVAVAGTLFTDVAVITALLVPWATAAWFVLRASDSRRARRSVGVLWDLTNYWPRMYHPWAPPAYNERAVPALERRVRTLLRDPAEPIVIVSAHSQGAVIAFAVMNRLLADPDLPHERLRFLTYGQLLDRHYRVLFPHMFNADQHARVSRGLPRRWISLYRETDPLGYPVRALGEFSRRASHLMPELAVTAYGHSSYPYSPQYQLAIDYLGRSGPPQVPGEEAPFIEPPA